MRALKKLHPKKCETVFGLDVRALKKLHPKKCETVLGKNVCMFQKPYPEKAGQFFPKIVNVKPISRNIVNIDGHKNRTISTVVI